MLLDRDESALHAVQLELYGRALLDSDQTALADVRDPRRVWEVFEQFQPEIVFHAAALKHPPPLERFPSEALKSNVWGTRSPQCSGSRGRAADRDPSRGVQVLHDRR